MNSNYVASLLTSSQSSPTQRCFTAHKRRGTSAPLCSPLPETPSLHLPMCRVTEVKNVVKAVRCPRNTAELLSFVHII